MDAATIEVRDTVREATKGVVEKFGRDYYVAKARDGGYINEMWEAMAEQGILGLGVPESCGGSDGGMVEVVSAMEAMSQAGTPPLLYLLTAFAREAIIRHGNTEQRERLVRPTVTGDLKLCFAVTEPNAGSNTFRTETLARRTPHGYAINGQKIWISGADEADYAVLVVRTTLLRDVEDRREGLSLFALPMDAPGVELQKLNVDMSAPERQYIVYLDDCEVGDEALIGEEGRGFHYVFDALNPERMLVAAWALGIGDYALDKAVVYARSREPFGTPIGGYQALQHPLARAKAHLEAARLALYDAASTYDRGGNAGPTANICKLLASEAAVSACDIAIQVHGGYAFDQDYDLLPLWQMARLLKIAPINNEMILNYLGEHVLGLPRSY